MPTTTTATTVTMVDITTVIEPFVTFTQQPIVWLPLVLALVILWCLVVYEKGGFATVVTLVITALLATKYPSVLAFITNPIYMFISLAVYATVGVLWSRFKWASFLTKKVDQYVRQRDAFLLHVGKPTDYLKTYPEDTETLTQFIEYMNRGRSYGSRLHEGVTSLQELHTTLAPRANVNKGAIVMWIAYWPISVIWFIVADLVTELAEAIYRTVAGHFQTMSDAKFDAI